MKNSRHLLAFCLCLGSVATYGQCGFLAGKVTDISGTTTLIASLSAKTDQGKVRLGRSDSVGIFNVEMPCNVSVLTIEAPQYQSLHIPINTDGKMEGTYFVAFALMPLGRQTSDEPYAQSEQKHFELKDSIRTPTSIIRRMEVRDALSNQSLPADICLYYTQKEKKDCFSLLASRPTAEIVFTEKDIVAVEVKSAGYQAYNGNLILDKTDQEPRTYIIKLNKQHTLLSVNIINAQRGTRAQLVEDSRLIVPLNRINDGHYFAEVAVGKSYNFGVSGADQEDFNTAVASLKEGLTLKSLRLPDRKTVLTVNEKPRTEIADVSGKTLYFPRSDYKLPPQSRAYLDSVAVFIQNNHHKGLEITGHTDNVGNPNLNLTLSEYRVRVITRYLINKGVSERLITAAGVGSKHPVRPNDTEENRRLNRRVEVQIIDLSEKK